MDCKHTEKGKVAVRFVIFFSRNEKPLKNTAD